MKKKSIRIFIKFLSVGILLTISSYFANAQHTLTNDDVNFNFSTGTIDDYSGTHTDIVIPQYFDIEGQVTYIKAIGRYAFSNANLVNVIIPEGIETIGEGAFSRNELSIIRIPDGVKSIESSAFLSNKLTEIVIPNSVNHIGSGAFNDNLISTVNGELSNGIFYHRNDDGSVDSTKTISYGGASDIVDFIPDKVKTLGSFSFWSCGIDEVKLPENLNTIEWGVFKDNNIEAFSIPNRVYFIDELAFYNNNFDTIVLPDPVINDTALFVNWKDQYGTVITNITNPFDPYQSCSAHFFKDEPEYPEINVISYTQVMNSPGLTFPDMVNCTSYNTLDVSINLDNYPITMDYTDVNIRSLHEPHIIICSKRVFFRTRDGVLHTLDDGRERRVNRGVFSLNIDMNELTDNQVYLETILYGNGQIKGYKTESIYDNIFKPYIWEQPSASSIKEGESLQNSILTEGSTSVCGQFKFKNPEFIPPVGIYQADVEFIPTRSDLYSTVETTALVEVGVSTNIPASSYNVMLLYYDPLADRLIINTGAEKILYISIYNTHGTLMANFKGNGSNKQRINLGTKNAGICLVKISTSNKIITRKLLLQ